MLPVFIRNILLKNFIQNISYTYRNKNVLYSVVIYRLYYFAMIIFTRSETLSWQFDASIDILIFKKSCYCLFMFQRFLEFSLELQFSYFGIFLKYVKTYIVLQVGEVLCLLFRTNKYALLCVTSLCIFVIILLYMLYMQNVCA